MWQLLAAGAAIGAGAGAWNTWRERDRQDKELRRQMANAEAAYRHGQELSDRQYGLQKGEALWQLGMQGRELREGVGQFTDEYNTRMLARAFGEQDARMQTESAIGGSLAQEGMSGTRGNAANQMARDQAATGLERQLEAQRRQDADLLAGTVRGANRAVTAMNHERDSWEAGGYRSEMKAAQDLYNKQMYEMAKGNYNGQLSDMYSWDSQALDYITGIFGGGSSGMGAAKSIYDYKFNFGSEW